VQRVRRALRALTVLLVLGAAMPAAASANGDPASDILISDTLYVPYQPPSGAQVRKLRGVIDAARKAGAPIRVALIQSPQDLGAVPNLFGHPREYAELLRTEITNPVESGQEGHKEALLVVMEAGYGTGNVSAEVDRKLRAIEVPAGASSDELAAAAGYGVQELAKATGHPIAATFPKPEAGEGGGGATVVVLIVVALLVVAAILIVIRVRAQAETDT